MTTSKNSTSSKITSAQILHIQQQLWQPNEAGVLPTVFVILDGARDKAIEKIVRLGELKSACLYEGNLSYQMSVAAPYMVRLEQNHKQTLEILSKGWGNSWGVFAITYPPATLIKVRHNCRKIARVKSPEGKNMIFRYYDPRVLRIYLDNCSLAEADKVFGPITDFICESETLGQVHRFRRDKHGCTELYQNSDINTLPIVQPAPSVAKALTQNNELHITGEHMSAFEAVKFKQFIKEMETHLITCFVPQSQALIEQNQFTSWVENNIEQAQSFGFITELDICRYLNVAIVQGENVTDQPWFQGIIAESYFPSTKANLLEQKSIELIDEQLLDVQNQLTAINQEHLELFYQTHHHKVQGIGVPLYDLSFSDQQALKDWMFRVGQQAIDLGLTDEMALDLWLDIAMRYGEHFPEAQWAQLTKAQQAELSPEDTLFYFLAQQPHKHAANA